jgi:RNA polymerase sigma factor (sigma-70 family)
MMKSLVAEVGPIAGSSADETAEGFVRRVLPYVPAMTRLAARLSAASEADDIVQEALVRAWKKRDRFDAERGSMAGWLLALTADQARRWRSRWLRRPPASSSSPRGEPFADLDLEAAIKHLSGRQRLAIECHYFVGLSITETAVVMGCSEGTVKSTLADARDRLRQMLGNDHG